MFFQQTTGIYIQMLSKAVHCHIQPKGFGKLCWAAFPFAVLVRYDFRYRFQHRVRRLLPKLILRMVKEPYQTLLIFTSIQPLIRLIPSADFQCGLSVSSFFFLHNEGPICTARQSGGAGKMCIRDSTQRYMEVLRRLGRDIPVLDKSLCHIIASGMFNGIFEMCIRDRLS